MTRLNIMINFCSRRIRVTVLLVLFGLLAFAQHVSAHAILVRSDPEPNVSIENAPARVNVWFTESLEPGFSRLQVIDANGRQVDQNDSRVESSDATQMSVGLGALPRGVYSVAWRALSTVDGHVTRGVFSFGIGSEVDLSANAQVEITPTPGPLEVMGRWLNFAGTLLLIGGLMFRLWIWRPVQQRLSIGLAESFIARQPWIGALSLLVAALILLLVQVSAASESDIWSAALNGSLGNSLFSTRYGAITLARIALASGTLALLPRDGSTDNDRRVRLALLVALPIVLTTSATSHAAAQPEPLVPLLIDTLHLTAIAVWIGALVLFAQTLARLRHLDAALRAHAHPRLVERFSTLGLICVPLVVASGVYAALLNIGSIDALLNTSYGLTLVLKLLLFSSMIVLAAFNLLIVRRLLNATEAQPDRSHASQVALQRAMRGEIALGALVLIAAALLSSLAPAQTTEAPRGLLLRQTVEDVQFALQIDPGRIGGNNFNVSLRDVNNNPIDDARRVRLRFAPPSADLGENVAEAEPQGDGNYSMRGNFLSLVGRWRIEIGLQRPDRFDAFARFDLDLSSGAVSASDVLWPLLAALALIGVGATYLFAMRRLVDTPRIVRGVLSIIPALAVAGLGVSFVFGALLNTDGELLNPIPPDARSIAAGRELYEQNCFVCHGPSGRGDGPAAINLNPRPVDLLQHVIVGVHPDAQLFDWISNGYPNSAMPAFASTLSENDRWDVLNFIRTFANQ